MCTSPGLLTWDCLSGWTSDSNGECQVIGAEQRQQRLQQQNTTTWQISTSRGQYNITSRNRYPDINLDRSGDTTTEHHTVIRMVWVSAKFGTCTVVSVNGTLVDDKMCTFTLESTHFIFSKFPICTHDGASAKFSTNSHETDYSARQDRYQPRLVCGYNSKTSHCNIYPDIRLERSEPKNSMTRTTDINPSRSVDTTAKHHTATNCIYIYILYIQLERSEQQTAWHDRY
jgi:hypothetical protein